MDNSTQQFPGFPKEPTTNYWRYPRVLNGWWYILTGSEQKVLDFILRHTWGFNKSADCIAYDQFINGVKNLDKGCGIKSQTTLSRALQGLVSKRFIESVSGSKRGKTAFYKLVFSQITTPKAGEPSPDSGEPSPETGDTIKDITIKEFQHPSVPGRTGGARTEKETRERTQEGSNLQAEEVIDCFIRVFKETHGDEPVISKKIETRMIKERLKRFSVGELKNLIRWFLATDNVETISLSPSLQVCLSATVVNRWISWRALGLEEFP